jgi:hypothetical protein
MSTEKDAGLILRLFEYANSERMQAARNYVIFEFLPGSEQDFQPLFSHPDRRQHNFYFQMVTRFWEIVAAFVNYGTLDSELFYATNNEHVAVWVKVSEFISYLRQVFGPGYLGNLETLVNDQPDVQREVTNFRNLFNRMSAKQQAAAEPVAVNGSIVSRSQKE